MAAMIAGIWACWRMAVPTGPADAAAPFPEPRLDHQTSELVSRLSQDVVETILADQSTD
jgi:hypothetical protein